MTVTKDWVDLDEDLRPDEFEIELVRKTENGAFQSLDPKITETIKSPDWKYTFKDLDAVDKNGNLYIYSVIESKVTGYVSEVGDTIEDGSEKHKQSVELTNTAKTTKLELTKEDSINGQLLDGAEFTLTYPDGTTTETKETQNGKLTFEQLQPGVYTLKETKAADGYINNSTERNITVTINDVENGITKTATIKNDPYANVTFTKVDAETKVALSGAVFKVVDEDDEDVEGFTGLEVKADGTLSITGLPVGEYKLVETTAPTGYELRKEPVTFKVEAETTTEHVELNEIGNDIMKGSVTFVKKNNHDEILSNVEFKLESLELVNANDDAYSETHYTNHEGIMFVDGLRPGTYKFTEVYPDGYQEYTGENLTFTIDPVNGETDINLGEITNYKLVDIPVTKVWNDGNAETRPDITIKLISESENNPKEVENEYTLTKADEESNDSNAWSYTFEDLPAVDDNGAEITYTVEEVAVEGYLDGKIEGDSDEGYVITNTLKTEIEVEKIWKDEDASERAPVTIYLQRNKDKEFDRVTFDGTEDIQTAKFENLPVYDSNGEPYSYDVYEVDSSGNYKSTKTVDNNKYTFTNVRYDEIEIDVTKKWVDTEETTDRSENITIELFRKGIDGDDTLVPNSTRVITPDSEGKWEYTYTNIPKYDDEGKTINYIVKEQTVPGYIGTIGIVADGKAEIINVRTGTITITGTKTWLDDHSPDRPNEITVLLKREGDHSFALEQTVSVSDDWTYSFAGLDRFDAKGALYNYYIEELEVPGYDAEVNGYDLINTRVGTTSVEGTKTWLDENSSERPDEITVILTREGDMTFEEKTIVKPDAEGNWTYKFDNLAKYDARGVEYRYVVSEESVAGYKSTVDGYNITNLRVGTTEVTGTKTWKDDNDATGDRPESINVNLLQNGVVIDTKEVTASDNWTYSFTELDKYDKEGVEYTYTIAEQDVPGYKSEVEGYNIINTRSELKDITITKGWLDDNSENRPDVIKIQLYQNNEPYGESVELTAADDWKYEFIELESFDADGKAYEYTVDEEPIEGYESTVESFNITNLRVGTTEVTGTKTWVEVDESYRPESITVNLLANGDKVADQEVTANNENEWTYAFTELPKYDDKGKEIAYTIEEESVIGYATEINGTNMTNTQFTTEVSGVKTWKEDDSEERPEVITIYLLQNGEKFRSIDVTAEDDWTYSFNNLVKFDSEGNEYTYTVEEELIDGYESTVDGYNITNLRVGTTEVTGTKTWKDDNDATENRPDFITVKLLQNGVEVDSVDVTAANDWTYSFTELDKYDEEGVEYTYTIAEQDVPGYKSEVEGYNIINTRSEQRDITITKEWLDDNSEDRPAVINVQLYQNGELYGEPVEISAANDWMYEFTELEAFDEDGKAYVYTVEEAAIEGYESTVDGFDITNLRVGKTSVEGTKTWKDENEADRPDSIKVNLLQNGVVINTKEVTASDDWMYSFQDLDKYDENGVEYEYTITEQDVPGYKSEIDGFNLINTRSEERDITVTKAWVNDDETIRPDSITVTLFQNGEIYDSVIITAEDGWKYTFENVPTFDEEGVAYNYTIEEKQVPNYETTIDGFDITNTHESGVLGKTIEVDADSQKDGHKMPKTATDIFNLIAAGLAFIMIGTGIFVYRRRKEA